MSPAAAFASGGGDECDDMYCSSFFAPEIIQNPAESPFFRSHRFYYQDAYDVSEDNKNNLRAVNLKEWTAYFGGKVKPGMLGWFLYKMTSEDLANLIKVTEGGNANLSPRAKSMKRAFDALNDKAKVLAVLRYTEFAKKVEPIANRRAGEDSWDSNGRKPVNGEDRANGERLIEAAGKVNADSFLAARYKFQVMRLYFYTDKYNEALDYYAKNIGSFSTESSVKYRFIEVAGGSHYRLKDYGKANYYYSLVFDRMPSMKRSSYFSFHPVEDRDWKETLAMAKSKREKEVLWQLLGIYADGMGAIDQIYKLNPKSELLPLLLVREVNKAEEDWTSNESLSRDTQGRVMRGAKSAKEAVGVARLAKLKAIADAGHAFKPYLWRLSVGHLMAMAGDTKEAELYVRKAMNEMPKEAAARTQARMTLLFARVRSISAINKGAETYLANELGWLGAMKHNSIYNNRPGNLNTWSRKQLSAVYLKGGDWARSAMLYDNPASPVYKDAKKIDAIIAFRKTAATAFDKMLVKGYSYSVEQLHELKALSALYKGNPGAAAESFNLAGSDVTKEELVGNPFKLRISDCHDCDHGESVPQYSKIGFAQKMREYTAKSAGRGEEAAEAALLLGNGYYNMSYYGNARGIYYTANSNYGGSWWDRSDSEVIMNNDLAEKAYLKAASLTSNRELKTKAIWGAAKADQNRWINNNKDSNVEVPPPGKYFKQLKDTLSDSKYYQEIIEECGHFKKYLGM